MNNCKLNVIVMHILYLYHQIVMTYSNLPITEETSSPKVCGYMLGIVDKYLVFWVHFRYCGHIVIVGTSCVLWVHIVYSGYTLTIVGTP